MSRFIDIRLSTEVSHDGASDAFPAHSDYLDWLIRHEEIREAGDLMERPELCAEIQSDWHRRGQTGCVFAQILSKDMEGNGWSIQVFSESILEDAVERFCASVIEGQKNPDTFIVSGLFPCIQTGDDLKTLLRKLTRREGWSLETSEDDATGRVGIAARFEFDDIESWALGLGPFDFLPATRRAPITELILSVKPKPAELDAKLNQDRRTAHLADAPLPIDPSAIDSVWATTQKRKKLMLDGRDDPMAKAKITFSFPKDTWST